MIISKAKLWRDVNEMSNDEQKSPERSRCNNKLQYKPLLMLIILSLMQNVAVIEAFLC